MKKTAQYYYIAATIVHKTWVTMTLLRDYPLLGGLVLGHLPQVPSESRHCPQTLMWVPVLPEYAKNCGVAIPLWLYYFCFSPNKQTSTITHTQWDTNYQITFLSTGRHCLSPGTVLFVHMLLSNWLVFLALCIRSIWWVIGKPYYKIWRSFLVKSMLFF